MLHLVVDNVQYIRHIVIINKETKKMKMKKLTPQQQAKAIRDFFSIVGSADCTYADLISNIEILTGASKQALKSLISTGFVNNIGGKWQFNS
jgi:hypothetical protein